MKDDSFKLQINSYGMYKTNKKYTLNSVPHQAAWESSKELWVSNKKLSGWISKDGLMKKASIFYKPKLS